MQKLILAIVAASVMGSAAALAQTTPPTPPANQGPSAVEKEMAPPASPSVASQSITLTDEQAKGWIDKVVYDSNGKKFGVTLEWEIRRIGVPAPKGRPA